MSGQKYRFIARADEFEPGQMRAYTIDGVRVLLCRVKADGSFHAIENECSHAYAALDEGRLRGHRINCPLHGACFDVRDGSVLSRPAFEPIRSFAVRVSGADVEVCLPR